jgi:hypothetical protein
VGEGGSLCDVSEAFWISFRTPPEFIRSASDGMQFFVGIVYSIILHIYFHSTFFSPIVLNHRFAPY